MLRGGESSACGKSLQSKAMATQGYQLTNSDFESALERTRTAMPFGTTPSRWRVYQFHHQGQPNSQLGVFATGATSHHRVPNCFFKKLRGRRGSNPRPLE